MLKNPQSILIKNDFYPEGLTEEKIHNYYRNNIEIILKNTKDHDLMFFIATDINNFIVKRKIDNKFIRLNKNNYEKEVHGRVVSIHSTMNEKENFGIIDIDTDNFELAKNAAIEIYDLLNPEAIQVEIRFTGKESFHIVRNFGSKWEINKIKKFLSNQISKLSDKYLINKSRVSGKVNLDLSSNKIRGGFITPGSLSILGLKCMPINRQEIKSFERNNARI